MSASVDGWAIVIDGDEFDLADIEENLQPPSSPWIESYIDQDGRTKRRLRSADWAKLDVHEVHQDAERIIKLLHGVALLLDASAQPFALGTMSHSQGGKETQVIYVATDIMHIHDGRVRVVTSSNNQSRIDFRNLMAGAEIDAAKADTLTFVTRSNNWFDLYKSMETARKVAGGENGIKKLLGAADFRKWKAVWQMANCMRHAPDTAKYPPPNPPIGLPAGRRFILGALRKLLA